MYKWSKYLSSIFVALLIALPASAKDRTCKAVHDWYKHNKYKHAAYATTIGMIHTGPVKLRGVCHAHGGPTAVEAGRMAVAECEKFGRERNKDLRRCIVVESR
jgi:hypothetical protein